MSNLKNFKYEYTRELPPNAVTRRFSDGEPILYAYECALLEREVSGRFIYTALNLITGEKEIICRRKTPLLTSEVEKIVDRMSKCSVAGARKLQADRPVRVRITLRKAREILQAVFTEIMPRSGFNIREEQIHLAEQILNTTNRRGVVLAEAGVGIGKTYGYIVPAIITKRGRLNDFHNMSLYPQMKHSEMSKMPIVIATSSIALQRAIMTEYIPQLSEMLLESGVIKTPLTAILRKGREHYICLRKLKTYLSAISNQTERQRLEDILLNNNTCDLAEIEDLTPKIKKAISVEGRCFNTCPHREDCRYLAYREQTQSLDIDIQVCNHNYLLADTLLRAKEQQPLIPNYQLLIIDEAHKFLSAARTMYGVELSSLTAPELLKRIDAINFKCNGLQNQAIRAAKKLSDQNEKLFKRLTGNAKYEEDESGAESDRAGVEMDEDAERCLRNIRDITGRLIIILQGEAFHAKTLELLTWVHGKYGADVSGIDLNKFMLVLSTDEDTRRIQVNAIYNAICGLKEIQSRVATEKVKNPRRKYYYSTERQAFRNEKSKILDKIWRRSRALLRSESATGAKSERLIRLVWKLSQLRDQAAALSKHNNLICWIEEDNNENLLCAIPKDLGRRLFDDQWSKKIPTILTSGTLSAAGDFSHIKKALGLDELHSHLLSETTHPSPFNYRENALLYISESMPFPNQRSMEYINSAAGEVEKLIEASHGHAAVLFTSYKVMDLVWEQLQSKLSFPLFRLDRGGVKEIERFKQSKGGVLFASGALWEGIDIPGDALSMLIIVKLPFAVPDPISEHEQTQYPDFATYRDSVIVPEMLVKLKQGFGRLIRTETDTGVVAILDSRANCGGAYRNRVLTALPDCRVTDSVFEIKNFFIDKKSPEYYYVTKNKGERE